MALDLTTVTQALKEHYKDLTVQDLVYKDNPLLALMPKYERFGGQNMPIPLIFGNPQRRSAGFRAGQDQTSTSELARFVLTRVKDYAFASITGETIKATESDVDAFLRYATMEIDGAMHALTRSIAVSMYRDGTGSIANVGSVAGSGANTVVTLEKTDDITNFEVGMAINIYQQQTNTSTDSRFRKPDPLNVRDGGGTGNIDKAFTVGAVDRSNGTITLNTNTGISANDAIVPAGDLNAKMSGLEAWVPRVLDTNNKTLFSQDRSTDVSRLGGQRFDGSSQPIEEALIGGASLVSREGGNPNYCFMDFASFSNLEKALGSKVVYGEARARDVDIGFASIQIRGPKGTIQVVPDQNVQPDVAWMLQLDTWTLNTLGKAPQFLDYDGNEMLREATSDAYEVRLGYYGNVACNAPGYNCRIALA